MWRNIWYFLTIQDEDENCEGSGCDYGDYGEY